MSALLCVCGGADGAAGFEPGVAALMGLLLTPKDLYVFHWSDGFWKGALFFGS